MRWEPDVRGLGEEDHSLKQIVSDAKQLEWIAYPVRKEWTQSSWLVGPERCLDIVRNIIDVSPYAASAREGINTRGANGVYFVDVLSANHLVLVRNRADDGDDDRDVPVVERRVESEHVFPLLRGRDVGKWFASPSSAIVLPHDPDHPVEPIPFNNLGNKTQDFLLEFKEKLRRRKKFRNFDPSGKNWHGLYSVLTATFAPCKVVWKEMASGSVASVVSAQSIKPGAAEKVVIPDHKLMIIPAATMKEAHFIAAILNSAVARYIVLSSAISTGISTHILDKLPIPRFDQNNPLHRDLANLSAECHRLIARDQASDLKQKEESIDATVGKLWNISRNQLQTILETVEQVHPELD